VVSFPQVSPPKPPIRLSSIRATCPAHLTVLYFITRTIFCEQYRSLSSSLCSFLHSPLTSSLLGPIFSSTPYFQIPSAYVPHSMCEIKFHTHTQQNISTVFPISLPLLRCEKDLSCMGIVLVLFMHVIITIIFINCNWVITLWQWLYYMYTNMEKK